MGAPIRSLSDLQVMSQGRARADLVTAWCPGRGSSIHHRITGTHNSRTDYWIGRASGTHPRLSREETWSSSRVVPRAEASGLTNRLNDDGVPTLLGKRWYPATVFHLLSNPTYAGNTLYRRTRTQSLLDPQTGRRRRHVAQRPEEDW